MHSEGFFVVLLCYRSFANCRWPTAPPNEGVFIGYPSKILNPLFYSFPYVHHHFFLIAVQLSSSTVSATNASVFGIAESHVHAHQPAPMPPTCTNTSCRTNLLSSPSRISGSDNPICRRGAASIEPRDTIRDADSRNASHLHTCTQPGRVTLTSTSLGPSWITRLLQGSSLPVSNSTFWT